MPCSPVGWADARSVVGLGPSCRRAGEVVWDDTPSGARRARRPCRPAGPGVEQRRREPSGTRRRELPRHERVPTRGQSTDGPIVMGSTHCDDGMEHAWSPGSTAAGRRPYPLDRVGAPSCGAGSGGARLAGAGGAPPRGRLPPVSTGRQELNLLTRTCGFRRPETLLRTFSTGEPGGLRSEPVMGHDGPTRSPSGLSERRTGFSPPELGSPTAPVVPPTGAVPCRGPVAVGPPPAVGRNARPAGPGPVPS